MSNDYNDPQFRKWAQMYSEPDWSRIQLADKDAEIARLREAIAKHRDQKGDDRCWLDDRELYAALDPSVPADQSLPPKCDFLKSCERYWEQRQSLSDTFTLKHPTIGQMNREITRLREALAVFAEPKNWNRHKPYMEDYVVTVWEEPWVETGVILYAASPCPLPEKQEITDPAAFARKALEGEKS